MIKKQRNINGGAAILFVIFSLLFFVLLFRFVSIQVSGEVKGYALAAKAKQNYTNSSIIEAKRGTIRDHNGDIISEDTYSYTLVAILDKKMTTDENHPNHVVDKEKTARELAKYIDMKESRIYTLLNKDLFQVEFGTAGRDISYDIKEKIEALELPGITFTREMKRYYPNGIFASHLIGFTEKEETDNNETKTIGALGLEKSLNDTLTGKNGSITYESDVWGYILPDGKENITAAQDGNDVYLTLDRKIQILLEDALNKVAKEYKPKKMVAIVANPKTGEILAMGQRPTFNPTTKEGLVDDWYNEAVEISFEPGSTMKIFTLSAAVEENVFNPNETYQSGKYVVDSRSKAVPDHNGGVGWGTITYLEGLQRSSNVAFAKLANEKIGFEKFREYLTKFGFDQPTGIDLPNETSGKIAYDYPIEKATTAFGQGTAITPIQQIQAATAIANDGKMVKPHVIEKIVNSKNGKTIKQTETEVVGTPISASTASQVREYLETVITSKNGTGKRYAIEGYSVAGKTGTAQIPAKEGGYLTGASNYIFSFLGMAPADDPQLIMYVAVQQPELTDYADGSIPVSMIFNPVMKNSLQYLQIQPSNQTKVKSATIPDVIGLTVEKAREILSNNGLQPVVLGNGPKVVSQIPEKDEDLLEGEKVVLTTSGELTAPDMTGWSLRDVMKVTSAANMKINSSGNGYVVNQSIPVGSSLKEGVTLTVELQSPSEVSTEDTSNSDGEE